MEWGQGQEKTAARGKTDICGDGRKQRQGFSLPPFSKEREALSAVFLLVVALVLVLLIVTLILVLLVVALVVLLVALILIVLTILHEDTSFQCRVRN